LIIHNVPTFTFNLIEDGLRAGEIPGMKPLAEDGLREGSHGLIGDTFGAFDLFGRPVGLNLGMDAKIEQGERDEVARKTHAKTSGRNGERAIELSYFPIQDMENHFQTDLDDLLGQQLRMASHAEVAVNTSGQSFKRRHAETGRTPAPPCWA